MEKSVEIINIESIKSIVSQRLCNWNDRVRDLEFAGNMVFFRTDFLTNTLIESLFAGLCGYGFSAQSCVSVVDRVIKVDFLVSVHFYTTMPAN